MNLPATQALKMNIIFAMFAEQYLHAGGHTAEMLTLLRSLGGKEGKTRSYVVAATDQLSAQKAHRYEEAIMEGSAHSKLVRKPNGSYS